MKLRVMLVEDQNMMREALVALLSRVADIEIVADTGSGIEATRQIVALGKGTKVLCLSGQQDRHHVDSALRAGAMGYQIKDGVVRELVDAIRAVGAGRSYLSPSVTATVVKTFVGMEDSHRRGEGAHGELTGREHEVLQLLANGRSVKELAFDLGVSVPTAYTHRRHIMQKLEMVDVASLIKYAIREGLTTAWPGQSA